MSDKIDQSCNTPKLVDDIALIMLKDVDAGRKRINDCDFTYAAIQAVQLNRFADSRQAIFDKAALFQPTAHRDLTEQVNLKAKEIYRDQKWFERILNHLDDEKK